MSMTDRPCEYCGRDWQDHGTGPPRRGGGGGVCYPGSPNSYRPRHPHPGAGPQLGCLHPDEEQACQVIDALLFSGDQTRNQVERLLYFLRRWRMKLDETMMDALRYTDPLSAGNAPPDDEE